MIDRVQENVGWLKALIQREHVDLIHARSRAPAWSAYWAAKSTRTPFVTTYHGAYNAKSSFKRWYNSVMARGDIVIANSTYIAAHIAQTYPDATARIVTIPRGVDLEAIHPDNISSNRTEMLQQQWFGDACPDRPLILLPGRLTAWKGQQDAISAMAIRRDRGADVLGTLVLAGDDQGRSGYLEALKAQITSLKLDESVSIVGHCSDMGAAYKLCDIVLAPSREPEAFGRVAAEAGAMGRPVIAAAHGGQLEIVDDKLTGRLVAPGQPGEIADMIDDILKLDASQLSALSQAARERIASRFSKASLQAATLNVYARLLERGH